MPVTMGQHVEQGHDHDRDIFPGHQPNKLLRIFISEISETKDSGAPDVRLWVFECSLHVPDHLRRRHCPECRDGRLANARVPLAGKHSQRVDGSCPLKAQVPNRFETPIRVFVTQSRLEVTQREILT